MPFSPCKDLLPQTRAIPARPPAIVSEAANRTRQCGNSYYYTTCTTVLLLLLLHAPGTQHTLHAPHAETRQPDVGVVFDEMFVQICTRPCPKTRSLGHLQGPLLPQKGNIECLIGLNVLPPKSPPLYHQGDLGGTFQPSSRGGGSHMWCTGTNRVVISVSIPKTLSWTQRPPAASKD